MRKNHLALAVTIVCSHSLALAQGVATEAQLKPITITGGTAALDPNLPNSTASKTAEQLREQNIFNPEDALKYVPNTTVRKRYIGDRNGLVAGRSFGNLQPGRGLVLLDGFLISNFLGRFDAPRWNMVNPEAVERFDVLYGPYSAIYPGNSIGTTIAVTERKPQGFEASVSLKLYGQNFKSYAFDDTLDGGQVSARIASRLDSGLWYALGYRRQESTSHPMQYFAISRNAAGAFPGTTGAAVPVSGIIRDVDPQGRERAIFGASTGALDRTTQETYKLRLGYEISPTLEADALVAYWTNQTLSRNRPFIRDANGQPVYSGVVTDGRDRFVIPDSAFAPFNRDEEHLQLGVTLKTKNATGWNGSVVATQYEILSDANRLALLPEPVALASGGAGTVTRRDGTGWNTLELQTTYTPVKGDFGDGNHALTFGLHRNHYALKNVVNNATDWRANETTRAQAFFGETTITALYAQDAWRLHPDVVATFGLRHERFSTNDGSQFFAATPSNLFTAYPSREISANSPKLSVAWAVRDDTLLRLSMGRGVRFPNVEELYNGARTGTNITTSDPGLKPERSDSVELSAEKDWGNQTLRVTLFRDDVEDTILRQTDQTVVPTVTRVSNIDRVVTNGLELVWQTRDLFIRGLSLDASLAWADATVRENSRDLASVGKAFTRIPKQRHRLQAAYRPNAQWLFAGGLRFDGRGFGNTDNSDSNPEVFGGNSRLRQADVRVAYSPTREWEFSVGIDNLNNQKAYEFHPYPQRTFHAGLRYQLR